jgi:PHD/YefM family antitoxin component YafN of YafNO toxin-antitoxin module
MESKKIEDLESYTIEEWEENFDELIDRVEQGETLMITSDNGNAVMMPVDDELLRIYSEHDEAS